MLAAAPAVKSSANPTIDFRATTSTASAARQSLLAVGDTRVTSGPTGNLPKAEKVDANATDATIEILNEWWQSSDSLPTRAFLTMSEWGKQVFPIGKTLKITLTMPDSRGERRLQADLDTWLACLYNRLGDKPPVHIA